MYISDHFSKYIVVGFWFILFLFIASTQAIAGNNKKWNLSDARLNHLLAGDVCEEIELKERRVGIKRMGVSNWSNPAEVFSWPVKSSVIGVCDANILLNTPETMTVLILSSNQGSVEINSHEKGWHRLSTKLKIGNTDTLNLRLKESIAGEDKAEIIGIEVITAKYRPIYEKQLSNLKSSIGDTRWFQEAGYGIMLQWGYWGYPRVGESKKPWQRIYQEFDIEAFANKMKELNPGYVIWSVTWRGSRFAAPLKSVEKIMGSKDFTMEYDFFGKLIDALNKLDIPVMFYYHPGHEEPEFWKKVGNNLNDRKKYAESNIAIWTEIGERLGPKLAGWFVDGSMVIHYPTDFYAYTKALKTGNPQRLVAFNPWKFPNCTAFEDMSMGEGWAHGKIENGTFVSGNFKGLMAHSMFIFDGPGWGIWKPNTTINSPKENAQYWQKRVNEAKQNKHPMSFCILMYEDGTIGEKTETVLKQLKR